MGGRDQSVAGGAQAYLRDVQYRDSSRLAARARLHVKYGTAAVAWFPWLATQVDWPRAARVLEVGCGAGWMWAEAAARLPTDLDLTLTDLSTGMVAEAVDRVGSLGRYRRTAGRVADVQELPFRSGTFDVVVANYVLHHVPDAGRAVGEMARVLRPGGMAVVACVGDGHLAELHQIRQRGVRRAVGERASPARSGPAPGAHLLPSAVRPGRVAALRRPARLQRSRRRPRLPGVDAAGRGRRRRPARARVAEAVQARFAAGGGRLRVSKDTGLFVCCDPG